MSVDLHENLHILASKARAYELAVDHLKAAASDPRTREQRRARIAIKHMDKWLKQAQEEMRNVKPS